MSRLAQRKTKHNSKFRTTIKSDQRSMMKSLRNVLIASVSLFPLAVTSTDASGTVRGAGGRGLQVSIPPLCSAHPTCPQESLFCCPTLEDEYLDCCIDGDDPIAVVDVNFTSLPAASPSRLSTSPSIDPTGATSESPSVIAKFNPEQYSIYISVTCTIYLTFRISEHCSEHRTKHES